MLKETKKNITTLETDMHVLPDLTQKKFIICAHYGKYTGKHTVWKVVT